jgi:hypothetical protein
MQQYATEIKIKYAPKASPSKVKELEDLQQKVMKLNVKLK